MNRSEFKDLYVGRNLAIHCDTIEKARELLTLTDSFGYKWTNGVSYIEQLNYKLYGENTCYCIYDGTYSSKKYMLSSNFKVIEYNQEPTSEY